MEFKKGSDHQSQLKHLKRIEGQVRGVYSMVENQSYCIDILTQIKAIRSSLASVERKVFNQHLQHCMRDALENKDPKKSQQMIDEIQTLLKTRKNS